jgi:hypothetical protein
VVGESDVDSLGFTFGKPVIQAVIASFVTIVRLFNLRASSAPRRMACFTAVVPTPVIRAVSTIE